MKRFIMIFVLVNVLYCLKAQQESGIQWVEGLNWQQIKDKAAQANKFILVDVYASWCVPCKLMDKNVYTSAELGAYVNQHFIAVKAQTDTSKSDDAQVQSWYADAKFIKQQYGVNAYPSFLFFSPDGSIVHRDEGYKNPEDFITLAAAALDSNKQYYVALKNYEKGIKNYPTLPLLIRRVNMAGDKQLGEKITKDYLQNYLYKEPEEAWLTSENISFMSSTLQHSTDKSFKIFYRKEKEVDRIMRKKGYAKKRVDFIIYREEIEPKLWDITRKPVVDKPNWNEIKRLISRKYNNDYASRAVLNAQIDWYRNEKDWNKIVTYELQKLDKYGIDTSGMGPLVVNNILWEVFEHSENRRELEKAAAFMSIIVKIMPDDMNLIDTYANLLFKSGNKKEAIFWEEKAVKLAMVAKDEYTVKTFEQRLVKMRSQN